MNDYILTCCSTADESRAFFEERDIEVIFFRWISDDGSVHIDDLGQSMPYGTFYDLMRKGMLPKTSQPNFQDFTDFFEPLLKDGKDVIHVSLGSAISGAFNASALRPIHSTVSVAAVGTIPIWKPGSPPGILHRNAGARRNLSCRKALLRDKKNPPLHSATAQGLTNCCLIKMSSTKR